MFEAALNGVIASICLLVGLYIMLKTGLFSSEMDKLINNFLVKAQNDTELQKRLFAIGGIIGQGIKTGAGINAKGGKFKIENLLGEVAGKWIEQTFLGGSGQQQEEQAAQPKY